MDDFLEFLVDVAVTIFRLLSSQLPVDSEYLYFGYVFCLLAVLIVLTCLFSLIPQIITFIYNLFRRSSE